MWLFVMFLVMFNGCGFCVKHIPPGQILYQTPCDNYVRMNVDVKDVNFHYLYYPGKSKTNIVLLHGFASSAYTWERMINELGKLYSQDPDNLPNIWAIDMKGFGWSDKPKGAKYDPFTLMEEVKQWIDLMNLKNVVFVGNSLGGGIAVCMAIKYPAVIDRLVLIDVKIVKPHLFLHGGWQ